MFTKFRCFCSQEFVKFLIVALSLCLSFAVCLNGAAFSTGEILSLDLSLLLGSPATMNHWFFTPFVPENTTTFTAVGFFTDIYCPMEKGESLMSDFTGNRYTEPGDFTQDAKVAYLENFPVFVQFLKYGQHVTGFGPKMFTDAPDKRYLPHVVYPKQELFLGLAMAKCMGATTDIDWNNAFLSSDAISNMSFLAGVPQIHSTPDYGTLMDFLAKGNEEETLDFFNNTVFPGMLKHMLASRRYETEDIARFGFPIIIDGTGTAYFSERHCEGDLVATYHKGTDNEMSVYRHAALLARVQMCPGLLHTLCLMPITNKGKEPESKQDCELKAAYKSLNVIHGHFPKMLVLLQGDGLFAKVPFMKYCEEIGWNFIFTLREGAQKNLCENFAELKKEGKVHVLPVRYGNEHSWQEGNLYYCNDLVCGSKEMMYVNVMEFDTTIIVPEPKHGDGKVRALELRTSEIKPDEPEFSKEVKGTDKMTEEEAEEELCDQLKALDPALEEKDTLSGVTIPNAKEILEKGLKPGTVIPVKYMYITCVPITDGNACVLLCRGRGRWSIETGMFIQKLGPLEIEHQSTLSENGMITNLCMAQVCDTLLQSYTLYTPIRKVLKTGKEICSRLGENFRNCNIEDYADYLSPEHRIEVKVQDEIVRKNIKRAEVYYPKNGPLTLPVVSAKNGGSSDGMLEAKGKESFDSVGSSMKVKLEVGGKANHVPVREKGAVKATEVPSVPVSGNDDGDIEKKDVNPGLQAVSGAGTPPVEGQKDAENGDSKGKDTPTAVREGTEKAAEAPSVPSSHDDAGSIENKDMKPGLKAASGVGTPPVEGQKDAEIRHSRDVNGKATSVLPREDGDVKGTETPSTPASKNDTAYSIEKKEVKAGEQLPSGEGRPTEKGKEDAEVGDSKDGKPKGDGKDTPVLAGEKGTVRGAVSTSRKPKKARLVHRNTKESIPIVSWVCTEDLKKQGCSNAGRKHKPKRARLVHRGVSVRRGGEGK